MNDSNAIICKEETLEDEIEEAIATPAEERSAQDYAKAIDGIAVALDVADLVLSFVPMANAPKAAVKLASHLPKVRAAVDAAPAILDKAAPLIDKANEVAPDAMDKLGVAAKGAGSAAKGAFGNMKNRVSNKLRDANEAREAEKARKEARNLVFRSAGVSQTAEMFTENWAAHSIGGENAIDYLGYSGCYVVVTSDKKVADNDYSHATDLYVGKGEHLGLAIHRDFIGLGNPDVYADVKFKQHVNVLLFPCLADKIETLYQSLIVALDADNSYNQVKE